MVGNGVYHSTDKGKSWSVLNKGLQSDEVISLICSPDSEIYAGMRYPGDPTKAAYHFQADSMQWQGVANRTFSDGITGIYKTIKGTILLGTRNNGILRIENDSVVKSDSGIIDMWIQAINGRDNIIFAATNYELFNSTDDGKTCTFEICEESSQSCKTVFDDQSCSNPLFCDGVEKCEPLASGSDPLTGCVAGIAPTLDTWLVPTVRSKPHEHLNR